MSARIYQPTKSATQSGLANTKVWIFEFEPQERTRRDVLMGWIGSGDTKSQVRLKFKSKEEAISYAEINGYKYNVLDTKKRRHWPKSYADNFRFKKVN